MSSISYIQRQFYVAVIINYFIFQILTSLTREDEDSSLLGCYAVLFAEQFSAFRSTVMASSGSNSLGVLLLDPYGEGTMIVRNSEVSSTNNAALHPRIFVYIYIYIYIYIFFF